LIHQVVALLGVELQSHQVDLRLTTPQDLPNVRGDRIHLQQVLLNLLLNSLEALNSMPAGSRHIEIGAARRNGGWVEVTVRDTGPGIELDMLPVLFEPFLTSKTKGTGLGLAISRTIVEAHGGRIHAENDPGGGACVRIELPVASEGGTT
jgi:signal transduction histidine kinase